MHVILVNAISCFVLQSRRLHSTAVVGVNAWLQERRLTSVFAWSPGCAPDVAGRAASMLEAWCFCLTSYIVVSDAVPNLELSVNGLAGQHH